MSNQKLEQRNIPGMNARTNRFGEIEHAENLRATLKRILKYFTHEKILLMAMLIVVIFGTLCGIYAPSLQSNVIDIISNEKEGNFSFTLIFMLTVYLIYSLCQLFQSLLSAKLSQSIVKRMREELFGKIVDLPIKYLLTHILMEM